MNAVLRIFVLIFLSVLRTLCSWVSSDHTPRISPLTASTPSCRS